MGSMKVWDGTAWQTASIGPSLPPVTSVDGRTGAVSLSDLYSSRAQLIQQNRAQVYTTRSDGWAQVFFPLAFKSRNTTAVVAQSTNVNLPMFIEVPNPNIEATYFWFAAFNTAGAAIANSSVAIGYIAVGERP